MHDNPIHNAVQFLLGQIPDQVGLGGMRWFTVALYWCLLLAGLAVAAINLQRDPLQRTPHHLGVFALRFVSAHMWYLGTLWKLPWPVSAGFQGWLENTVKYSSWQWHADFMQVFVAHIALVQPLVYLLEVFFTVSLMLGFMVRLSGFLAALFTFNLLIGLYNDPTEWVWTYVGIIGAHAMFALSHAGRSLGVDNLLERGLVRVPVLTGNRVIARAYRLAS